MAEPVRVHYQGELDQLEASSLGGLDLVNGGYPGDRVIWFYKLDLDSAVAARLPRAKGRGGWTHHGMQGYTARGAGTAIVPVRFNCPPEITLHRLQRAR